MDELAESDFRVVEIPVTFACDGSKSSENTIVDNNIIMRRPQEGNEHDQADGRCRFLCSWFVACLASYLVECC